YEYYNKTLKAIEMNKSIQKQKKQKNKDIIIIIKNELNKNTRKLDIHQKTLKKANKKEDVRKKGELLTANMHIVERGDKEVSVIDYYEPLQSEIIIKLDTAKAPSENAQTFF